MRIGEMQNKILYDNRGIPDIMVAYTPEELGLPEVIRGRIVEKYLISKYPATMINGVPYSLPFMQPATNVSFEEAVRICEAKGNGWHLMTNDEWAALAHQSRRNETFPRGNTNNGKSPSHPDEAGMRYPGSCGKTLTGSGPVEGVADLCGNLCEYVGGLRFLNRQVQVIPENGAAARADPSRNSKEWTPIRTRDDNPIFYHTEEGKIEIRPTEPDNKQYNGIFFKDLESEGMDVPDKLTELGLFPEPDYESEEYFYLNTEGERFVCRGGHWGALHNAGVFCLYGNCSRTYAFDSIGFRAACVRYEGDSEVSGDAGITP